VLRASTAARRAHASRAPRGMNGTRPGERPGLPAPGGLGKTHRPYTGRRCPNISASKP